MWSTRAGGQPDPNILPDPALQAFADQSLPRILEGERVRHIQDVPNRQSVRHLMVGVPLILGSDVSGAVFVATPVQVVLTNRRPVFRLIWLIVGGGAVTSDDEVGLVARSFNHMAAQLEQLERLRREFVANVSHELRTPLTSLRGFLQGTVDGAVPQEDQAKYLHLALSELERLNRLVGDLLDLASLESGRFTLQLRTSDAFELARRALLKLEPVFAKKHLEVSVDLPQDPGMARIDPDRFEQVLLNLLQNAAQFTPEGGCVNLAGEADAGSLSIAVTDSGPGIDAGQLPHIWDRFYRADHSRSVRGTGLGLTIARYLVEAQGGHIDVESTPGEGSTFTVTLPAAGLVSSCRRSK